MKTSVNFYDFCRAFETCGRNENFSYEGKRALFEYLEELEESTGEEIELDVVALCCDYAEYATAADCIAETGYAVTFQPDEDEAPEEAAERHEAECLEYLQDNTTVIEFDGGIIIQSF